jgi:hypothetical protein
MLKSVPKRKKRIGYVKHNTNLQFVSVSDKLKRYLE